MQGVKGGDLLRICSMYESYRLRPSQRLLGVAPTEAGPGASAAATAGSRQSARQALLERRARRLDYRTTRVRTCGRRPSGKLKIKSGEADEDGEEAEVGEEEEEETAGEDLLTGRFRRCRVGDGARPYRHAEPPLMITPHRLPHIFRPLEAVAVADEARGAFGGTRRMLRAPKPSRTEEEEEEEEKDGEGSGEDDDEATGKKAVSFGGVRLADGRRIVTRGWSSSRGRCQDGANSSQQQQQQHQQQQQQQQQQHQPPVPCSSVRLSYSPAKRSRHRSTAAPVADGPPVPDKTPTPRRGRLHVRFAGARSRGTRPVLPSSGPPKPNRPVRAPVRPAGPKPSAPGRMSILKPSHESSAAMSPMPCFPCSPEFERTFRSLRGHKKIISNVEQLDK